MKKLLSLLIITLSFSASIFAQSDKKNDKIHWRTIEEVEALQLKEARKVLVDVYTVWCGPCKMMMKNTFGNKNVIDYINTHYYAVKFDAESGEDVTFKGNIYKNPGFNPYGRGRKSQHQLAQALGVRSYPTIIYMDENMEVITPIKGYLTPTQIELYLKLFAEKNYEEIGANKTELDKYFKNFTPKFGK